MFWKKTGLLGIVLAALAIVGYAQTQKPRSTNLQTLNDSGYLGVGVQNLSPDDARTLGLKETGVKVTLITTGGPGDKAGIRQNDVIVEFNGQKVEDQESFQDSIIAKAPGTKVNLIVLRGATRQNVVATLGTRPLGLPVHVQMMQQPGIESGPPQELLQMMAAAAAASSSARPGFNGVDLEPQLAAFFGVREGVLVSQVYEKTSAERAGLKAGDVVTKVNGIPVASTREISGVVRQANKKLIAFTIIRDRKEMTLNIEIASNRFDSPERGDIN